jgi:hypothetical protein
LRSNLDSRDGSVFRHEPNFIDLYGRVSSERGLQLFGQSSGLRAAAWKCAHKA